jgi:ABC-type sugar transport system ATPase subunit
MYPKQYVELGEVVLQVDNLTKNGIYKNISFELHQGEILGMAGLIGAGRTEVALSIFGDMKFDSGTIKLNDRMVKFNGPNQAIKNKIAYLPEDRKLYGVDLNAKIKDNIGITNMDKITKMGFINSKKEKEFCENAVKLLSIKTPSIMQEVGNLSGGNQQKVALVKWITRNVDVLILDEPTRGIDVGAKEEIHKIMGDIAKKGVGIILISSELPEVLGMSDRIIVMHEGELKAIIDSRDATQELLMTQMIGQKKISVGGSK